MIQSRGAILTWWTTVEDLTDGTGQLLGAPEGAIGDIDVDRESLLELLVENRAERGKDTLESLDATAEIEPLLAALKERLLDLGVLLARTLSHDMVKEVDGVDAIRRPGSLAIKEGTEMVEVNLASPLEEYGVFVALARAAAILRPTLFLVQVDGDAGLITVETLSRPAYVSENSARKKSKGHTKQACCRHRPTSWSVHRGRP